MLTPTQIQHYQDAGRDSGDAAAADMWRDARPATAADWHAHAATLRLPGLPSDSGWDGELPSDPTDRPDALAIIQAAERKALDAAADAADNTAARLTELDLQRALERAADRAARDIVDGIVAAGPIAADWDLTTWDLTSAEISHARSLLDAAGVPADTDREQDAILLVERIVRNLLTSDTRIKRMSR